MEDYFILQSMELDFVIASPFKHTTDKCVSLDYKNNRYTMTKFPHGNILKHYCIKIT